METEAYMRLYDPRVFPLFNKQVKEQQEQFYVSLESIYVENTENEQKLHCFTSHDESTLNLKEL